ncbi:MAG: biopolymer transport protein ExbB [Myxococcota bacterium]|jgi:biopolymer transport protein ExbB
MLRTWLDGFSDLLASGGLTMPPLILCAAMIWFSLGMRFMLLRRGSRAELRVVLKTHLAGAGGEPVGVINRAAHIGAQAAAQFSGRVPHSVLEEIYADLRLDLEWGRLLIRSLVAMAPLLGLLGTVTGMIETFRSLADMALFTQGGGIAGGIGEALLTTQVGLAVSVPGLIAGRLLDRKQELLEGELSRLGELLSSGAHLEAA